MLQFLYQFVYFVLLQSIYSPFYFFTYIFALIFLLFHLNNSYLLSAKHKEHKNIIKKGLTMDISPSCWDEKYGLIDNVEKIRIKLAYHVDSVLYNNFCQMWLNAYAASSISSYVVKIIITTQLAWVMPLYFRFTACISP